MTTLATAAWIVLGAALAFVLLAGEELWVVRNRRAHPYRDEEADVFFERANVHRGKSVLLGLGGFGAGIYGLVTGDGEGLVVGIFCFGLSAAVQSYWFVRQRRLDLESRRIWPG